MSNALPYAAESARIPTLGFPVCFEKTIFYKKLLDKLGAAPERCFWISTSPRWSAWLEGQRVPKANILQISKRAAFDETVSQSALERVRLVEADGGVGLNQVASSDRVLSGWSHAIAQRYLAYVVDKVWSFLEAKQIQVLFGEMTTHIEFLTAAIARLQRRLYFVPESVRSPSSRFLFFRWNSFRDFYRFQRPLHPDAEQLTRSAIEALSKKRQRPHYWFEIPRAQRISFRFVYHTFFRLGEALAESETNALVWSARDRIFRYRKYLAPLRNIYLRISTFFERPPPNERFFLFPLHRQPEASVDAAAPRWQNQVETVRALALELPFGTMLYVKEHFSALGERPMGHLRAMKRIRGVRLIDPRVDTYALMEKAQMVITIAGTASLESTILGTRAITLAPVFFNNLPSLPCLETGPEIGRAMRQTENIPPALGKQEDFLAYKDILVNSHEGVISDPLNAPYCIEEPNLLLVSKAFRDLFLDLRLGSNEGTPTPLFTSGGPIDEGPGP